MPPRKTTAARGRTQGRTTRNQRSSIPSPPPREEAVPVVPINVNVAHVRELCDYLNRHLATMDQTSLPQGGHTVLSNDEPQTEVNLHHDNSRNLSYLDYRREFYISNPPTFDGTTDPTKADTWLYTIEEEFNKLEVPNSHRVNLAAGLLIDRACRWWRSTKNSHGDDAKIWNNFRTFYLDE